MRNPGEFQRELKKILKLEGWTQVIVMIDELFPGFVTDQWKNFKGIENTDLVLALRHAFNDGKCLGRIQKLITKQAHYSDVMEKQGVFEEEGIIFCHLRVSYRCTKQLIDLIYYLLIHSSPEDKLYTTKSFIHLPSKLNGETPVWLEVNSIVAFIEYSNTIEDNDVLLIYDPDYCDSSTIQTLRGHCMGRHWKSRSSSEVMGSEASTVIVYDLPKVHFESLSRAVNQLVLVTMSTLKTSLSKALQDIVEKNHDSSICQENWKRNSKMFNQVANTCQFFTGSSHFSELLVHKEFALDIPDNIEPTTEDSDHQAVSDFCTQLVLYEDLKDEVRNGCRAQEDAKKPENDLQAL